MPGEAVTPDNAVPGGGARTARGRSLQRQLPAWMLIPLGGIAAFNIATSYRDAHRTADLVADRTLSASGRIIAEQIRGEGTMIAAPVPWPRWRCSSPTCRTSSPTGSVACIELPVDR